MATKMMTERAATYWGISSAVFWVASYAGARILLDGTVTGYWGRASIALFPVLPFSVFLLWYLNSIRQSDELQRRVHLEALAIAFPLTVLLLMTLGLLETAVGLDPENWSYRHVWAFLPLLYFAGLAFSWRRYK